MSRVGISLLALCAALPTSISISAAASTPETVAFVAATNPIVPARAVRIVVVVPRGAMCSLELLRGSKREFKTGSSTSRTGELQYTWTAPSKLTAGLQTAEVACSNGMKAKRQLGVRANSTGSPVSIAMRVYTAVVPSPRRPETTGSLAHTWTDYLNAGGSAGPTLPAHATVSILCRLTGFRVSDGNSWWYVVASNPWMGNYYVSADAFYNNGETSGSLLGTPFVDAAVPVCRVSTGPVNETSGSDVHTWSDYLDAGGTEGRMLSSGETVAIACRVPGFTVADGNTWWYKISSSPWDGDYFASADAFYNDGAISGPLAGTPFVDLYVPLCAAQGTPETTGGVTHTWSDYSDAGGTEGPSIAGQQTVEVACRTTGFKVADGNTWWYEIASSPWNDEFYASADAFYNDGATSGSLKGTPFVDTAVPIC